MKYALFLLLAASALAQSPKRLFIEERVITREASGLNCSSTAYGSEVDTDCSPKPRKIRTRDVSSELTRDIAERCGDAVTVTDNKESADYRLHISPGSSLLYNAKGDVVFTSPAKVKLGNVGKDVCQFISSH